MHYIRGSRHDFDGWAKEGCQGWSYTDVLPYFIKSEDIQIPRLQNSGVLQNIDKSICLKGTNIKQNNPHNIALLYLWLIIQKKNNQKPKLKDLYR